MQRISTVQRLRDRGFDQSTAVPFATRWHVRCSQCAAVVINGTACHEFRCPNAPGVDLDDDDREVY